MSQPSGLHKYDLLFQNLASFFPKQLLLKSVRNNLFTHTLRGRKYSGYMMMTMQPVTPKTTCSSSPAGCKKTHTHLSLHFCYTPQPICYGNSEYWKEMPSFLILHVTRQLRESRKKRRESESYYCQQLRCLLTVLG